MSDLVKVALISGAFSVIVGALTLAGVIISNRAQAAKARLKSEAENARKEQELKDQLANILSRLDEHNGYAAKFSLTTESVIEIRNDIRWLKEKVNG